MEGAVPHLEMSLFVDPPGREIPLEGFRWRGESRFPIADVPMGEEDSGPHLETLPWERRAGSSLGEAAKGPLWKRWKEVPIWGYSHWRGGCGSLWKCSP